MKRALMKTDIIYSTFKIDDLLSIPLSILNPVHVNTQRLNRGVSTLSRFNITTIGDFIYSSPIYLIENVTSFGTACYEELCQSIDAHFKSLNIDITFSELYHSVNLSRELQNKV
jgi:hypothetical protein